MRPIPTEPKCADSKCSNSNYGFTFFLSIDKISRPPLPLERAMCYDEELVWSGPGWLGRSLMIYYDGMRV